SRMTTLGQTKPRSSGEPNAPHARRKSVGRPTSSDVPYACAAVVLRRRAGTAAGGLLSSSRSHYRWGDLAVLGPPAWRGATWVHSVHWRLLSGSWRARHLAA